MANFGGDISFHKIPYSRENSIRGTKLGQQIRANHAQPSKVVSKSEPAMANICNGSANQSWSRDNSSQTAEPLKQAAVIL